MQSSWKNLIFTLLLLALSGCGFQLKGTGNIAGDNSLRGQTLVVISNDARGELTLALLEQLRLAGAVVSAGQTAALSVQIGREDFSQRNLSLTAQARSAEIELLMRTDFSMRTDGDVVVASDAQVIRQYLNDPQNIVGKTEELRLLREEMRRDLAAQIVRRLGHSLSN